MKSYILAYLFILIYLFEYETQTLIIYSSRKWYYRQFLKQRISLILKNRRDFIYSGNIRHLFNDPDIYKQWYFIKNRLYNNHLSHELDSAWDLGITGEGVTIGLIGEGVDVKHKDLKNNFEEFSSYNFVTNSKNISYDNNGIPTSAVGLISATPNNKECGVGAAPFSHFSVLQLLNSEKRTLDPDLISNAFLYNIQINQIYVLLMSLNNRHNLWTFVRTAVVNSIKLSYKTGRNGYGSIIVMGAGNKRALGDNCGFNAYAQMAEVFVFGAMIYNGSSLTSSERCNAILAASLSAESNNLDGKLFSTSIGDMCQNYADGSYTAASISAGILALLISAKQYLTPRQILFLVILSSIQYDKLAIPNSGGFFYSYSLGFGMLNIESLIALTKIGDINYIALENICKTGVFYKKHKIPAHSNIYINIYTSGCLYSYFCVNEVEQTFVVITIITNQRKSISAYLKSPSGTKFEIIKSRSFDRSTIGFRNWRLKLMGFFSENPIGIWELVIYSNWCCSTLVKLELIFYGSCVNPGANIIFHKKVKNYVCSNTSNISSPFRNKMCFPYTSQFYESVEHDYFSFSDDEYPNITDINRFS